MVDRAVRPNKNIMRMKKLLMILIFFLGIIPKIFADEKNYKNGQVTAYLSGNRVEIVDNVNNVCVVVNVTSRKNSVGETIYNLACGNKYTKNIAKLGLRAAIESMVRSAASTAAGPAAGAVIGSVAGSIASDAYDDICKYFGD